MAEKIPLVQGDNLPRVALKITDRNGAPADLTGCTGANLHFKQKGSTAAPIIISCAVDIPESSVSFEFPNGALDGPPGDYQGEISLDFSGKSHTLFDPLQFKMRAQFA